uniref:AUDH_Cupin domain-containing protein n=2 Tax=Panagrellus redivivus TaxID=6233 RepID=A0A7E4ZYB2_PANRE
MPSTAFFRQLMFQRFRAVASGSDMTSVRITPLKDSLVENGVYLAHNFDAATLKKLDWPVVEGRRFPEGGNGGEFLPEPLKMEWKHGKLIFPIGGDVEIPIAVRHGDKITYDGGFVAQLDSDVAYFPEKHLINLHSKDFLIFVCAQSTVTGEKEFRAIRVPHGYGIVVEAFVAHSTPIPLHDNDVEFKVYHRSANAVAQFRLSSPLVTHLSDVDESTTLIITKQVDENASEPKENVRLSPDFSKGIHKVEAATQANFCSYGLLVEDHHDYKEEVHHVAWPASTKLINFPGLELQDYEDEFSDCRGEALVQDFRMTWEQHPVERLTKNIRFNGLTGSFAGAEGKPGVEFDATTGKYSSSLLQTRPDGSFYIHPIQHKNHFLMIFAKPDASGEPIKDSIKVFSFGPGQGARIPPNVWHSVPIPFATEEYVEFRETISETNANVVLNVEFESSGPIEFTI